MMIMSSCKMLWILVLVHLVHCFEETDDFNRGPPSFGPSWQYKCVPEMGCQRVSYPLTPLNPSSSIFNSLDVCRTVCGHFGGLWPKPITAVLSMQTVGIHPSKLRFDMANVPAEVQKLLEDMTHVVRGNLLDECGRNVTQSADTNVVVYLEVESSCTDLTWDTDEEYRLNVQTRDDNDVIVRIVAKTVFGARHGLETFTQLVAPVKSAHLDRCGLRLVSRAEIRDRPAYGYRGLLLDSSRNFLPMRDIKRMIDGMASTKLNVFHWHVTDSQSFPLESIRVPQFTRYGAYSPQEIYTIREVEELVQYAKVRGVRVVIEIDAPAHAGNGWQWGKDYGLGDLAVCVNAVNWRQFCIEAPCGQLNPANPEMYKVLKKLYRDIADVLPKPSLFHMGGDEVFIKCWNSSDEIASYMGDKGMDTTKEGFIELWAEFHNKALQMWDEVLSAVGENAQPVMLWSSELTQADRIETYLDKERYVIEVWEPLQSPLLNQLLALGYRTISIPKDLWYLDHGFWGETRYSNWRKMYSYTLPRHRNMLGGEVAMWSEYVDVNALDARVWPRAAAVAERLWADPPPYQLTTAEPRLQRHRQRLIARGLRPDVIGPEWCAQNDAKCV